MSWCARYNQQLLQTLRHLPNTGDKRYTHTRTLALQVGKVTLPQASQITNTLNTLVVRHDSVSDHQH